MLTLNGKHFAETETEFKNSLFNVGGTCSGYVKFNKASITILDHNKVKVGVINKEGVLGCATKQPNGKWWYSYATIKIIGEFESYKMEVEACKAAIKRIL